MVGHVPLLSIITSDDARRILTEQTKARLAKLFDEWATGGDKSTSADLALATP